MQPVAKFAKRSGRDVWRLVKKISPAAPAVGSVFLDEVPHRPSGSTAKRKRNTYYGLRAVRAASSAEMYNQTSTSSRQPMTVAR